MVYACQRTLLSEKDESSTDTGSDFCDSRELRSMKGKTSKDYILCIYYIHYFIYIPSK